MADADSMVRLGVPWAWANEIAEASPSAAVLVAAGCPVLLAATIAANSGTAAIRLQKLMASGLSSLQAVEVDAELND